MTLVTHYADLDGLGSIVFSRFFGFHIDHIYMIDYSMKEEDIFKMLLPHKEENLLVTDYRVFPAFYDFLNENFPKRYFLFDHHEESLQYKDKIYENIFVEKEKCGTRLLYDIFFESEEKNKTSDYLMFLIDAYDMWKKESPLWEEALNLNRVLWNTINFNVPEDPRLNVQRFELFINLQVEKLQKDFFRWTNYELDRINYAKMQETLAVRKALDILQIREDSKGKRFGLWWGKNKVSFVCSKLMEEINDLDYVVCISTYQPNRKDEAVNGRVSVRSKDENIFDVTTLVNINGHKAAGGGEFTIPFLTNLWKGVILQIPYRRGE